MRANQKRCTNGENLFTRLDIFRLIHISDPENNMAILKVARMGHPVLRAPAEAIPPEEVTSAPVQQLIEDMLDTCEEYDGIGLAAPQVHFQSKQSFRNRRPGLRSGLIPSSASTTN